jgi:diacylglycerol kinase
MTSRRGRWVVKFRVAAHGVIRSVQTQVSFWIHLPVALAVLAMAIWLRVEPWRWTALVIVITVVLIAELINTAIEQLVVVLHPAQDQRIGQALDAAAAAVLVAAAAAIVVGLLTLGPPLWQVITRQG